MTDGAVPPGYRPADPHLAALHARLGFLPTYVQGAGDYMAERSELADQLAKGDRTRELDAENKRLRAQLEAKAEADGEETDGEEGDGDGDSA